MSIIETHYTENNANKEKIYRLREAANEAGVAVETIRKAIKKGDLPAMSIPFGTAGRCKYMIGENDLLNWVENKSTFKEDRPGRVSQTRSIQDLTLEEFGGELFNRLKKAWDEGYKKGVEDTKKKMITVIKEADI